MLDAQTHIPIEGAAVLLLQRPTHTTYTDTNGYFILKATRNFHWAYTDGGGWPDNKNNSMAILKTNYFNMGGNWSGDIGTVYLEPKQ